MSTSPAHSWTDRWSAVGVSLTVLAAIDLIERSQWMLPNPTPIAHVAIVYGAFRSGFFGAAASLALTTLYFSWFFSDPGVFLRFSPLNADRFGVFLISAATIGVMVAALKERLIRLHREALRREAEHQRELEAEIRERKAAQAELEISNRELEAFSYSVSHDLRAPLRGIEGFSRILQEEYREPLGPEGRRYLDRIRAGTRRMGQLIDDLLALSRLSRVPLERRPVNLAELARRVAEDLARSEPDRRVGWTIPDELHVEGDPRLLQVALQNLLGNAFKFTARREDAVIELGAVRLGGETACFVRDNGAGFDMAYSGQLFGPFQRLHTQAEFPGNGIGLATVQRIVRRHGGRIWAEGALEHGATFYFTLN